MPKFDWKSVKREDVLKAIELYMAENLEHPEPKNTFLLYEGKKLPAKHIRGMAYKIAHNQEISKEDYAGGMETVRFFERLGFEMSYLGQSNHTSADDGEDGKTESCSESSASKVKLVKKEPSSEPEKTGGISDGGIRIPSKNVIQQKNALQLLLNRMFDGDVVCEKTYEWLKTPEKISEEYLSLYHALKEYRGNKNYAKKNVTLRCDFVCESQKLIVEYDERQHFSEARRIALESYASVPVCFDRKLWIQACEQVQARDNQPPDRDETRAYYDSVRDIESYKHGYRLIRIMHGQVDFESKDAYEKLHGLIGKYADLSFVEKDVSEKQDKKPNLKIAMYLQADQWKNKKDFGSAMEIVRKADIDVLVFPEVGWTPFEDILQGSDITQADALDRIYDRCEELSSEIGCAVVVSSCDMYGILYSVFANAFAEDGETRCNLYIKHTATCFSAFDFMDYQDSLAKDLFEPISFKGYSIGLTICYDCNHALFSRMYGVQGVDIILNSTGGDVVFDKWYKYNSSRAMENGCYTFVTMGGDGMSEKVSSYVFGFNREGKALKPHLLNGRSDKANIPGGIYVFDLSEDDGGTEIDRSLRQTRTRNKNQDFLIPVGETDRLIDKAEKIEDGLFVLNEKNKSIVLCVLEDDAILRAEEFLPKIYSKKLAKYHNRRYVLVCKYKDLKKTEYENRLSLVLKVRAMENFCAVVLESDIVNNCYQTGMNRTAQVILPENGYYGLDLSRMTGPEAIWKNKTGMRASWRDNFAWLASECRRIAENNKTY